jgi:hypothetical protein
MTAFPRSEPIVRLGRRCRFAGAALVALLGCGGNPETAPGYTTGSTATTTTATGSTATTGSGGSSTSSAASSSTSSSTSSTSAGGSATSSGAGGSASTSGVGGSGMESDAGSAGGGSGGSGASQDGGVVSGARCKTDVAWANLGRIDSIPGTDFSRFGAISADELTVTWTVTSGDVYVADRSKLTEAFGVPAKVNGATALAMDRAALSPARQTVIAIRADRGGFVGFVRASLTDAWMPSSGLEFTQVRVVFEGGTTVSEPVLSPDKQSFYFVLSSPSREPLFYESRWDGSQGGSWGLPASLPNTELKSTDAAHRRRPTGASADGRTLFFFDEVKGLERAAWRESPTSAFDAFRDVGAFPEAMPTQACDMIYYQRDDASGRGVFNAE